VSPEAGRRAERWVDWLKSVGDTAEQADEACGRWVMGEEPPELGVVPEGFIRPKCTACEGRGFYEVGACETCEKPTSFECGSCFGTGLAS
jgi:hypothetical protein